MQVIRLHVRAHVTTSSEVLECDDAGAAAVCVCACERDGGVARLGLGRTRAVGCGGRSDGGGATQNEGWQLINGSRGDTSARGRRS